MHSTGVSRQSLSELGDLIVSSTGESKARTRNALRSHAFYSIDEPWSHWLDLTII